MGSTTDRAELIELFGPISKTAEVITGGDGRHLYFQYSGGPVPKQLAPGIDLKGDGGYVVAPPSLHVSGKRYEWDGLLAGTLPSYFADAPGWLLDRFGKPPSKARAEIPTNEEKWGKGQRNDQLTSLAGSMRRRGLSREAIEAALLEENPRRCDPPLSEAEVRGIAESVASYEPEGDSSSQRIAAINHANELAQRAIGNKDPANCYAEDLIHAVAAAPAKVARDLAAEFKSTFREGFNITRFKADVRDAQAALVHARHQAQTQGGRNLAAQFQLTDDAVIYIDPSPDKQSIRICDRLEVTALIRDVRGDGWGRVLRWKDPEGRQHQYPMPASLLAGDAGECRARLLDGGLAISPSRKAPASTSLFGHTWREPLSADPAHEGGRRRPR